MLIPFYVFAAVAVLATLLTIIQTQAVHALLYLIVSLLAVAGVFWTLGAPFVAVLEVIVYAGAIMVLFVFVVMMLNVGDTREQERAWLQPGIWIGPAILSAILLAQILSVVTGLAPNQIVAAKVVDARAVGIALYGPYLLAVELASLLLLAGLVAAYHLGRRRDIPMPEQPT